jgi:hypothetical protein
MNTKITLLILLSKTFSACHRNVLFFDDFEKYRDGEIPASPWEKSGAGKIFVDILDTVINGAFMDGNGKTGCQPVSTASRNRLTACFTR